MLNSRRLLRRFGALAALAGSGLLLAVAPASAATLAAAAATDFDIATYVEGLGQPTDVSILPDGRAVIIQRSGDIAIKTPAVDEYVEAHIDVDSSHAERGLLGVIADPGFATNSLIYFYASSGPDANNRHQILRYKLDAAGVLSDKTVVVNMGLRGPANHNGGAIDIYGGNMYIGVGDTGANATPPQNHFGSCLNVANGKVLRVSLADATLGQPPADNPLNNVAMVTGCTQTGGENGAFGMFAPEKRIYAWGFRNPFRLWVDQTTGKVWVGDVGETTREEISVVELGKHYGYPFHEGTTAYNQSFKPANDCMGIVPASACVEPVFDYARGGGGATIGGRILDGCAWKPEWKSRYIFGDHEQGKIWTLDVNQTRTGVVANSLKDFATSSGVVAFRMGTDNALYIVEEGNGRVSRVTAKGSTTTPNSCPSVNGDGSTNPPVGGSGAGGNATGGTGPNSGGTGNPGTGGTGNPATGGTGNPATGGNNPGTGGTGPTGPGNPSGGSSPTSGGTNGSSAGAANSADDGGCGCRAAGGATGSALSLAALVGALGLAFQRRRRAPRS